MPVRSSSAVWNGNLLQGNGTMKLGSGAYEGAYSFASRFESGKGTNPEELIAAAHAGCFSMALSLILGEAGFTAERIETKAAVTLDKVAEGFEITTSHLDLVAKIPGIDQAKFDELANKAKAGCPVSKVLKAKISMDARLEQ